MPKPELNLRTWTISRLNHDLPAFIIDRQTRNLSPRTIDFYREKLTHFVRYCRQSGIDSLENLTAHHLRLYLIALRDDGHNPGGRHAHYRAVKTWLRWYESEYEPTNWRNPIEKVPAPKVPQEPLEPVSLPAIKQLLATCKPRTYIGDRDKAIILALLDTGCRASEFVAIDVADLDMQTGAAIIRHGKGGKARAVFFGAKARRAVMRYLRHGIAGPLWQTRTHTRLTYGGLRAMMRRRAKVAGIAAPSLHSFRRAFAINSLRNGIDVISLQRILGHSDLSVIKRYLAQTTDDLAKAHSATSPVDRML